MCVCAYKCIFIISYPTTVIGIPVNPTPSLTKKKDRKKSCGHGSLSVQHLRLTTNTKASVRIHQRFVDKIRKNVYKRRTFPSFVQHRKPLFLLTDPVIREVKRVFEY